MDDFIKTFDAIDDIKEKISDAEYLNLSRSVHNLYLAFKNKKLIPSCSCNHIQICNFNNIEELIITECPNLKKYINLNPIFKHALLGFDIEFQLTPIDSSLSIQDIIFINSIKDIFIQKISSLQIQHNELWVLMVNISFFDFCMRNSNVIQNIPNFKQNQIYNLNLLSINPKFIGCLSKYDFNSQLWTNLFTS